MQHLQKICGGDQLGNPPSKPNRQGPFFHGTRVIRPTVPLVGAGKETPVTNAQRLHLSESVRFNESRVPADSQLICKRGTGPTSHLIPSLRVPLWRREQSNFQFHRTLSLALTATPFLT